MKKQLFLLSTLFAMIGSVATVTAAATSTAQIPMRLSDSRPAKVVLEEYLRKLRDPRSLTFLNDDERRVLESRITQKNEDPRLIWKKVFWLKEISDSGSRESSIREVKPILNSDTEAQLEHLMGAITEDFIRNMNWGNPDRYYLY